MPLRVASCVLLHVRFGSVDVNGTPGRAASRLTAAAAQIGGRISALMMVMIRTIRIEQQELEASLEEVRNGTKLLQRQRALVFITKRGQPLYH